jgi:tol-pal system protein YbgF
VFGVSQAPQAPGAAGASATRKAFKKGDILELLNLEAPDALLIPQVRAAGVDFVATQNDMDEFLKAGASNALQTVIREASERFAAREKAVAARKSIEGRVKFMTDQYKSQGNLVASIIATVEGTEDSIVGRLDNGDYFKATVQGWSRLDPDSVKSLSEEIKDDLNSNVEHPLVWVVGREHIEDKDYEKNHQTLMDNARIPLFGHLPATVIVTLYDPEIPQSAISDKTGHLVYSKVGLCNLSRDHCRTEPITSRLNSTAPAVQDVYLAGVRDYNAARYDAAAARFQQVLQSYPQDTLAGEAQFYLGEISYWQQNYPDAVKAYNALLEGFPDSVKTPVAQLRMGLALLQMNKKDEGIHELRLLIQRYPQTPEAARARAKLISLGEGIVAASPETTGFTGRIHGRVTNPTGAPQAGGTVSLSTDSGRTSVYTFAVSASGEYAGEAAPGRYTVVFRQADTPLDKTIDSFQGIQIAAGQDVLQDVDMSRAEFVDKLPPQQRKTLNELRQHNSEAMKVNDVIKRLNADLSVASQDIKDADGARVTAIQALGSMASNADLDAREAQIKAAKYAEVEALMLRDTGAKPDASILWAQLGQAQVGLKKYDEAKSTYRKALEIEAASKKPSLQVQGLAMSGFGEIYARTGKVQEANAAYDAAARVNPSLAALYLRNEAIIFFQMNDAEAQVAAANEAILADPNQPLVYYLKGQGLIQKATINPKTAKIVLPPGCLEAYRKYLELAPSGPYAAQVKSILEKVR